MERARPSNCRPRAPESGRGSGPESRLAGEVQPRGPASTPGAWVHSKMRVAERSRRPGFTQGGAFFWLVQSRTPARKSRSALLALLLRTSSKGMRLRISAACFECQKTSGSPHTSARRSHHPRRTPHSFDGPRRPFPGSTFTQAGGGNGRGSHPLRSHRTQAPRRPPLALHLTSGALHRVDGTDREAASGTWQSENAKISAAQVSLGSLDQSLQASSSAANETTSSGCAISPRRSRARAVRRRTFAEIRCETSRHVRSRGATG